MNIENINFYSLHAFFQQAPTWIEIDKYNANDDADTERVEEKLLY